MARISRGSLVMRCMGSRRKDFMLRCWHLLCVSSLRRYSRNITFFSLDQTEGEREFGEELGWVSQSFIRAGLTTIITSDIWRFEQKYTKLFVIMQAPL